LTEQLPGPDLDAVPESAPLIPEADDHRASQLLVFGERAQTASVTITDPGGRFELSKSIFSIRSMVDKREVTFVNLDYQDRKAIGCCNTKTAW
jgi:hypothetical protein